MPRHLPDTIDLDDTEFSDADAADPAPDLPLLPPRQGTAKPQAPHPDAFGGMGFVRRNLPGERPRRERYRPERNGRGHSAQRTTHPIDAALGEVVVDVVPRMKALGIVASRGARMGKPNVQGLSRGAGIGYKTAYWLVRQPDAIQGLTLDTIARLCEYLHCQPGDILSYVPRRA